MFGFSKKKQVCNNMELYQNIQNDGVEYVGAKIAYILTDKWLKNHNLAYQFVLQELEGASLGNETAEEFVKKSGVSYSEYNGALSRDMPSEVEQASLFLVQFSMGLQPLRDLIVELRLETVNEVMKLHKIGIYQERTLYQDGLLDSLEPFSLIGYEEIVQPWTFSTLKYDLDIISNELPKNYNALMPTLYAARFAYAGLYNQNKITWEEFDDINKNHFMGVMIKIGNRISRSEQVYFQEKSMEKALELLQKYEPLIDIQVVQSMIKATLNKFSLQEAIGDDLVATSHLTICYYSEFGYDENEDEFIIQNNFIEMLNRL